VLVGKYNNATIALRVLIMSLTINWIQHDKLFDGFQSYFLISKIQNHVASVTVVLLTVKSNILLVRSLPLTIEIQHF
jgi:hypothetical protein